MSSNLQDLFDESVKLTPEQLYHWSTSQFCQAKVDKVIFEYRSLAWASQIPRRLGGQASGRQLSADKKFMRQGMHLYRTLHPKWGDLCDEVLPVDWEAVGPEEKSAGAQMSVSDWVSSTLFVINRQLAVVATVSIQAGLEEWGGLAVKALRNESSNIQRIYKQYQERGGIV